MFALSLVRAPAGRPDRLARSVLGHGGAGVAVIAVVAVNVARAAASQDRAARPALRGSRPRRPLASGRGRLRAACGAAGDVGGHSRHAGQAGLPKDQHWQVYLPAVLASFVVMGVRCSRWSAAATCAPCSLGRSGCRAGAAGAVLGGRPSERRRARRGCCSSSSAASTCWKPASPAWPRGRAADARAPRWACTTRCNLWDFSPAGRSADG